MIGLTGIIPAKTDTSPGRLSRSLYKVSGMDCAAEEELIRLKLMPIPGVRRIEFNLPDREVAVFHNGSVADLTTVLEGLRLGAGLISITPIADENAMAPGREKSALVAVLAINFFFFLVELLFGFFSRSMGLIADSLDMLADAVVYGLSLWAINRAAVQQKNIARLAGYFQLALALLGIGETVRRFLDPAAAPDFKTMIIVSAWALCGNVAALFLLKSSRGKGAHMKASWIFTSNDVIANLGVISAGFLVLYTASAIPDLAVGCVVFILVALGAFRIMSLAR